MIPVCVRSLWPSEQTTETPGWWLATRYAAQNTAAAADGCHALRFPWSPSKYWIGTDNRSTVAESWPAARMLSSSHRRRHSRRDAYGEGL